MTSEEAAVRAAAAGPSTSKTISDEAERGVEASMARQGSKDGHFHYHGHRSTTFVSHDIDELTELRARRALT